MQVGRLRSIRDVEKGIEDPDLDFELLSARARSLTRNKITEEEAEHLKALKRIKNALIKFDLSKNEVRVYLFLARFGAQKAQRIAESLNVHRTEAYKILRRLERQGLVSCVFERPMKFVSVNFERALSNLIEEKRQRIHQMEQWKKELLLTWQSLPEPEKKKVRKETFQVLEGRRQLTVKATELLEETSVNLLMVLGDKDLLWLYNSPFFDDLGNITQKKSIDVRLMTNYSPTSTYVLDEVNFNGTDFAYKNLDESPCFIIGDDSQMLLLMKKGEERPNKPYAMWTNHSTLLQSYSLLFELLWDKQS
jgi:predicted transcriptional regulator